MLKIGVPKEIKPLEKRVGLTPSAVQSLCENDLEVFIETNAGRESGFKDEDYIKAGAEILPNLEAVYHTADLIQKVKEPLFPEFHLIHARHTIFSFLHLASPDQCDLVAVLQKSGATAIAYETVEKNGVYPLLAPMSEIAGTLASAYAAVIFQLGLTTAARIGSVNIYPEFEKIAAHYPHFPDMKLGSVVIFGGGVAGLQALKTAQRFGANVTVVEKDPTRKEFLKQTTASVYTPDEVPKSILEKADVFIGCVHSRSERAARVIEDTLFRNVSTVKNKVIMDVSIDQGGNFPESRVTSYRNPFYQDSLGNLRFGVSNIPSLCGHAASNELARLTTPYTAALARSTEEALEQFPELKRALSVQAGKILLPAILEAHRK